MSVLSKKLLSALEKQRFSHDALQQVAKACRDAIQRDPAAKDAPDHVMLYVIEDFCFRTAAWMDAMQPITTEQHALIQAAICPPLKAAISKVSEPLSCDERMSQIAELLEAGHECRRAKLSK